MFCQPYLCSIFFLDFAAGPFKPLCCRFRKTAVCPLGCRARLTEGEVKQRFPLLSLRSGFGALEMQVHAGSRTPVLLERPISVDIFFSCYVGRDALLTFFCHGQHCWETVSGTEGLAGRPASGRGLQTLCGSAASRPRAWHQERRDAEEGACTAPDAPSTFKALAFKHCRTSA